MAISEPKGLTMIEAYTGKMKRPGNDGRRYYDCGCIATPAKGKHLFGLYRANDALCKQGHRWD